MKRKLVISAIAVVAAILVLALIPFLISADAFRPRIEERLELTLGRQVEIGKVRFSLLAGGIRAENIRIADDPVFSRSPFLRAQALDVGVERWPLITSRAVRITSLKLREPELVLVQSPRGEWNFSSIGQQRRPPGLKRDASGARSELSIQELKLTKGQIVVIRPRGTQTYSNVSFDAKDVSYTAAFPFTLSATMPGNGALKVEGKAGPVPAAGAAETPFQATFNLDHLDLGDSGYFGHNSGVDGSLSMKGSASSDGRTVQVQASLQADKLRLTPGGTPARQPVTAELVSAYDLNTQAGRVTRGDIYPKADSKRPAHLTGSYQTRGATASLGMELRAENLPTSDLENVLPAAGLTLPGGASLQGGTVTTTLAISGPVDHLVATGPVQAANVKIAGFNLGAKAGAIGALAGVQTGPDTLIERLSCTVRAAPEGMRLDNINAQIARLGNVTGRGTIGANHALDFHLVTRLARGGGLLGGLAQAAGVGQLSTVAFRIQGTTANPTFVPDVASVVQPRPSQAQPTQQSPLEGLMGIFGRKK
ncbi:MAG: AsmA family protein [Terriglobales bacterium]